MFMKNEINEMPEKPRVLEDYKIEPNPVCMEKFKRMFEGDGKIEHADIKKEKISPYQNSFSKFAALFEGDNLENEKTDAANEQKQDVSEENPHQETRDGKTYYYDDNGILYRVDKELQPNTEYEINGYKYKTDKKGRIISAEGNLHIKDREGRLPIKDSLEDIGKGDEKEGDDRGHLIGDQFDGSNGMENMVPQDADINRKDFKNLENELAQEVKDGKKVYVKVEPQYKGDSRRPVSIKVTYYIDGEKNVTIFPNSQEGK